MRARIGLVSFVLALLPPVAAVKASAQQPEQAAATPPAAAVMTETVDVEIVNIDVHVTDRQGAPITGLARTDFQVFENGERVDPVNFYELVREDPEATTPIWVVLYFDLHNLLSANRDGAIDELEQGLPVVLEDSRVRVMVASHDDRPEVIHGFTRNWASIRGALASLRNRTTIGDQRDGLRQSAQLSVSDAFHRMRSTDRLDRQNAGLALDGLLGQMRTYAREVYNDAESSFEALGDFVRTLAWLDGRKAVVFVSDGIAERPLGTLMEHAQDLLSGSASSAGALVETRVGGQAGGVPGTGGVFDRDASLEVGRLQQEVEQYRSTGTIQAIVAEANTYGVTLFAAKPPPGNAAAGARRSKGRGALLELSDYREALHALAEGTGGFARTGGGRLTEVLPRAVQGMQSYYSLGLSSSERTEGEFVAVEVRVRGVRGATTASRSSYVKKSARSRIAERALAAAVVGHSENPHRMEVEVESMTRVAEAEGIYEIGMWVDFPIGSVELVEAEGVHRAAIRLVVVALAEDDQITAAQHLGAPLEVPSAALADAKQSHYRVGVTLRLPEGPQRLALGLWDEFAESGSVIADSLTVGSPE